MRLAIGAAVGTLLLGAALAGCGDDTPAVCNSVDNLQTSVDNIKDIDVTSSTGVEDLQSGLTTVESDLADVKTDAESEFSPQIDAVDTAFAKVKTSVDAAKADPTPKTLASVSSAVSAFNAALQTLTSDVQSTC